MALPLTETDKRLLLGALGTVETTGRVVELLEAGGAPGTVIGPLSATDNALVRFDGITGALVQNSTALLSDLGALSGLASVNGISSATLAFLDATSSVQTQINGKLSLTGGVLTGGLDVSTSAGPQLRLIDGGSFGVNADPHLVLRDSVGTGGSFGFLSAASNDLSVANLTVTGSLLFKTANVDVGNIDSAGKWTIGPDNTGIVHTISGAVDFSPLNTYRGGVAAGGAWTIGSSGFTSDHQINGAIIVSKKITFGDFAAKMSTPNSDSIVVGRNGDAITGTAVTVFGNSAFSLTGSGNQNDAFGSSALASSTTGTLNTAFGANSVVSCTSGSANVGMGGASLASLNTGTQNVAVGRLAGLTTTTGSNNIMFGYFAVTSGATASNEFIVGSDTAPIYQSYIGSGVTSITLAALTLNATGAQGTDTSAAASTFAIAGGRGTGTGAGGSVLIKTAPAGASGSTLNTLVTVIDARTDSDVELPNGNLRISLAGKGLRIKEGSNAKMGVSTLVAGTVTVSNTSITANSRILLTKQDSGTPVALGAIRVSARSAGVSFDITSDNVVDTSDILWVIIEPA